MSPAKDDAIPVYVQTQGAVVGKSGDQLEVKQKGQVLQKVRLMEVSHLALFGNIQVTTQAVRELCDRNIPICYFSYGGWFRGITNGMSHKNVELRCRQYLGAMTPDTAWPIRTPAGLRQDKELPLYASPESPGSAFRHSGRAGPAGGPGADGLIPGYSTGHRGGCGPDLFLRVPGYDQGQGPVIRLPGSKPAASPGSRERGPLVPSTPC